MTDKEYEQFKEFINRVLYEITTIEDYEIILRELNIPIRSRNGLHYRLLSGCHNETYEGVHASLDFNTETRTFVCYVCNCSYNLLTLTQKRFSVLGEEKSRFQCLKWICNRLDIPFEFNDKVERNRKNIYNWKKDINKYLKGKNNISEDKEYDESILNYFPKIYHTDWLDFGISIDTMEKYNIRYYQYKSQIVIPVNYNNKLVGIRVRNMNPSEADMFGKYRPLETLTEQYNFRTSKYFYGANYTSNEILRTKRAILIEGEKSQLKSDTWFGDKSITLGMFGHELSDDKLKYLISLGIEDLYIMIDWDYKDKDSEEYDNYVNSVNKIYFKCKPYIKNIYVIDNPNEYNDYYKCNPFDLTREQYDWFWERKELIE